MIHKIKFLGFNLLYQEYKYSILPYYLKMT